MTGSSKVEAVTGVITVAVAGITASFSAADVQEWGSVVMSLAPLMLILFLIWRIHKLDIQHRECGVNLARVQDQLLLTYKALNDATIRCNMPSERDFMRGHFDLPHLKNKEN